MMSQNGPGSNENSPNSFQNTPNSNLGGNNVVIGKKTDEKIERITEIIWKVWWFVLYIIILPILASWLFTFILKSYFLPESLPEDDPTIYLFFLFYLPSVLIFYYPFDRYRKKRFFRRTKQSDFRHIFLYFAGVIIAQLYCLIINIFIIFIVQHDTTTTTTSSITPAIIILGPNPLFDKILFTSVLIIFLVYYLINRVYNRTSIKDIKDIEVKNFEGLLVFIAFLIRILWSIFLNAEYLMTLFMIDGIFFILIGAFYKFKYQNWDIQIAQKVKVKTSLEVAESENAENPNSNINITPLNSGGENSSTTKDNPQDIAEGGDQSQYQIISVKLEPKVKNRAFFNVFPIVHITLIGLTLSYFLVYMAIFNTPVVHIDSILYLQIIIQIFILSWNSSIISLTYHLKKTPFNKSLTDNKDLKNFNATLDFIGVISAFIIFFYYNFAPKFTLNPSYINHLISLSAIIYSFIFIAILILTLFIEGFYKLVTKKFYTAFGLAISILFDLYIGVILPIDISYRIIIFTVLLYIIFEVFIRFKLLTESKFFIIQSFLLSLIVLEVNFNLATSLLEYVEPLMAPNNLLFMAFKTDVLILAFVITSILTLLYTYQVRLRQNTTKWLKFSLIFMHILLNICLIVLFYINPGNFIQYPANNMGIKLLNTLFLPALILTILNALIFMGYGNIKIYDRIERTQILLSHLEVAAIFLALSFMSLMENGVRTLLISSSSLSDSYINVIIITFYTLASFFFLNFSLIAHIYLAFKRNLIKSESYIKLINKLAASLFVQIGIIGLFAFKGLGQQSWTSSIFLTSVLLLFALVIFPRGKSIFTKRFRALFIFTNLILQVSLFPIVFKQFIIATIPLHPHGASIIDYILNFITQLLISIQDILIDYSKMVDLIFTNIFNNSTLTNNPLAYAILFFIHKTLLNFPLILITTLYIMGAFKKAFSTGIFWKRSWVTIANLSFFIIYFVFALIPNFILSIMVLFSPHITNQSLLPLKDFLVGLTMSGAQNALIVANLLIYSFILSFSFLLGFDLKVGNFLYNQPKIWIYNAIHNKYITFPEEKQEEVLDLDSKIIRKKLKIIDLLNLKAFENLILLDIPIQDNLSSPNKPNFNPHNNSPSNNSPSNNSPSNNSPSNNSPSNNTLSDNNSNNNSPNNSTPNNNNIDNTPLNTSPTLKVNEIIGNIQNTPEPLNLFYGFEKYHHVFFHITWASAAFTIIYSFFYFAFLINSVGIDTNIAIPVLAIIITLLYLETIKALNRTGILSPNTSNILQIISYLLDITSVSLVVYYFIIFIVPFTSATFNFVSLLALDFSLLVMYLIIVKLFEKKLIKNPKPYLIFKSLFMSVVIIISSIVIAFLPGQIIGIFSPDIINLNIDYSNPAQLLSYLGILHILTTPVFAIITSITLTSGFLHFLIPNLKRYNTLALKDIDIEQYFPIEEIEDVEFSSNFTDIKQSGECNDDFERLFSGILRTIRIKLMKSIIYSVFIFSVSLYFWLGSYLAFSLIFNSYVSFLSNSQIASNMHIIITLPKLAQFSVFMISTAIYGLGAHILLNIDKKYVGKNLNHILNKELVVSWGIFAFCFAIVLPILIESEPFGYILLLLFVLSVEQLYTYYLVENDKLEIEDQEKWLKIKEYITKILPFIFSALYLATMLIKSLIYNNISESVFLWGNDASTIDSGHIYAIMPLFILIIFVWFNRIYLSKLVSPKRYLKTLLLSFPLIILAIKLMPFQIDLIHYFSELNINISPDIFKITFGHPGVSVKSIIIGDFLLTLVISALIIFPLFYYYTIVRPQNLLFNWAYQSLILFIGFIFIYDLIFEPWVILIGGHFAPQMNFMNPITGMPDIITFLQLERLLFAISITFIAFYYIKKMAYFEAFEYFTDENPYKIKKVGTIAGFGRSIAFALIVFIFFQSLNVIFGFDITKIAPNLVNIIYTSYSGNSTPYDPSLISSYNPFAIPYFMIPAYNAMFISASVGLVFTLSLYYFLKGYLSYHPVLSYKIRYLLRVIIVLSAALCFFPFLMVYQSILVYITPVLGIIAYIILIRLKNKYGYRGSIINGVAKGLVAFGTIFLVLHKIITPYFVFHLINIAAPVDNIAQFLNIHIIIEILVAFPPAAFLAIRNLDDLPKFSFKIISISMFLTSVISLSSALYIFLINLHAFIPFTSITFLPIYAFIISFDFAIALLYLATIFYQHINKIPKNFWNFGWKIWLIIPLLNFSLFYKFIANFPFFSKIFTLFNFLNLQGSILTTIIFFTILYLPVLITKIKKFFRYALIIIWIESVPLWIWLSQNLFMNIFSPAFAPLVTIISAVGLIFISILPILYFFRLWKPFLAFWTFITLLNATFFSLVLHVDFVPDFLLKSLVVFTTIGIFIMIFAMNPLLKQKWPPKKQFRLLYLGF
ncbi:MAG: hypothetical protein ACTSVC_07125, partial [Promethearchaeota archaeon]